MLTQCVDRRPPGCLLRLDVGSGEAHWKQPTWPSGAGYNGTYTATAGFLYARFSFILEINANIFLLHYDTQSIIIYKCVKLR